MAWVAVAVVAVAALAIQYRIHLSNEWQQRVPLPPAIVHKHGDRILVFAPHSDEETLGCGGMVATSIKNGADVRVALMTNGDGFRIAVGRAYNTLHVTPGKCIEFAYKRQRETLRALKTLGLPASHVTFLGYPDRGVEQLWSKYWSPDRLYLSPATMWRHSPYRNSFTFHAPYCGESLIGDIEKLIKADKPTDVYVPHPCDNHPDHYATYCFAMAAIEQLHAEGVDFSQKLRVHTYLVHRGDWPIPKGYHPKEPLGPPYGLARGDTKWYSLALSPEIVQLKRQAIGDYRTQTAVERGFLMSFARDNEIFGDLPDRKVAVVPPHVMHVDGEPDDWTGIAPAVVDSVGDYVVAGLSKGGDVRSVYLCTDGKYLYVRIDCVRRLSKRITYILNFRGLRDRDSNDRYSVSIRIKSNNAHSNVIWAANGNVLELALPMRKLRFDQDLFVQVQTKLMNLTIDNTGWHGVEFKQMAENREQRAAGPERTE